MNEEEKKKLRDINFKVINCPDKLKGLIERDEIIYLFKILEKQQAEIQTLKRDFEIVGHECSRLEQEDIKKDKLINILAEQLTTPVHSKEWVIDFYKKEIEKC